MIAGKRVLAVVPARGGSKGVPGKNLRLVRGRPLIAWTIEQALRARSIDRVILSSDDESIMREAQAAGADVPFRRPADLATDAVSSIDVVLHALEQVPDFDIVVLLQPTSPLRNSGDIEAALNRLVGSGAKAIVSVTEVDQSPFWMFELDPVGHLKPILSAEAIPARRQDLRPVYSLNGAIYAAESEWLRRSRSFLSAGTVAYLMPPERSLDIDEERDFWLLDKILEETCQ